VDEQRVGSQGLAVQLPVESEQVGVEIVDRVVDVVVTELDELLVVEVDEITLGVPGDDGLTVVAVVVVVVDCKAA